MWRKRLLAAGVAVLIALLLMPVLLCENALHIQPPFRRNPEPALADDVARDTGSTWNTVEMRAADGVPLRAWWFRPQHPNGAGVILLHGVADTRRGMLGHARLLLARGYSTLLPDSRGHGVSGGGPISYGNREADDVHRWANWLLGTKHVSRIYGAGQSMGAAILIQSLRVEPRFRALVADCPFYSFEEIARYRLNTASGFGPVFTWPLVRTGMLYARARYGLDLSRASPAEAIRTTHVPILLIHGTEDHNVPTEDSVMLHALNPAGTRLWIVQGAGHVASISTQPEAYARTVVDWFAAH